MRSLIKLVTKLRQENTELRQQLERLKAEIYGNEYDDELHDPEVHDPDECPECGHYDCDCYVLSSR